MLAYSRLIFCIICLCPILIWAQNPVPDAYITRINSFTPYTAGTKSYTVATNDQVYSLFMGGIDNYLVFKHNNSGVYTNVFRSVFSNNVEVRSLIPKQSGYYIVGRYNTALSAGDSLKSIFISEVDGNGIATGTFEYRLDGESTEEIGAAALSPQGKLYIPFSSENNTGVKTANLLVVGAGLQRDTLITLNRDLNPGNMFATADSNMVWLHKDLIFTISPNNQITNSRSCNSAACPTALDQGIALNQDSIIVAGSSMVGGKPRTTLFLSNRSLSSLRPILTAEGAFNQVFYNELGEVNLSTTSNFSPCFFTLNSQLTLTDSNKIKDFGLNYEAVAAAGICGGKYLMSAIDVNSNQAIIAKLDTNFKSYCTDSTALLYPVGANLSTGGTSLAGRSSKNITRFNLVISRSFEVPDQNNLCSNNNCNLVELPTNILVCSGEEFIISPTVYSDPCASERPGNRSYSWTLNNANSETLRITESGSYSIRASEDGCPTDEASVQVTFDRQNIDLNPPYRICTALGDSVLVEVQGFDSLRWSTGDSTEVISLFNTGNYGVTALSSLGCLRSENFRVHEFCSPEIWVPNAFTPNGDGINDDFKPVSLYVDKYDFRIYTRLGEEVFATQDPDLAWDGNEAKGSPAPIGLFVWRLEYQSIFNGEIFVQVKVGHVSLVR